MNNRSVVCFLLFVLFLFANIPVWAEAGPVVVEIGIQGNKRIEKDTILKSIALKPGDELTSQRLRDDIATIYKMGYFDNIEAAVDELDSGVRVNSSVVERPFIFDITFDGNDKVMGDDLKKELTLKAKTFLDLKEVEENRQKIINLYKTKGFYNVEVYPLIQLGDEKFLYDERQQRKSDKKKQQEKEKDKKTKSSKNLLDIFNTSSEEDKTEEGLALVSFFIRENEKSYITQIEIEGNEKVSDKQIKKLLTTKRKHWFKSVFTDAGIYNEFEVRNDIERIRDYYLNNGFLQVAIADPDLKLSDDRKWFYLTFKIKEGEQFKVGKVALKGVTLFDESDIIKRVSSKEGELVSREKIQHDIEYLTAKYGDIGRIFANVTPKISTDLENKNADIIYDVDESLPVYIREIVISGNDKTYDRVIRREIRLDELERVDTSKLRRSYQRINNLNFFETVDLAPRRVAPDQVDLEIKVKEKSTGTFSVGGGYSSVDKAVFMSSVTEGNFLGKGQLVRLNSEIGKRRTTYSITFREPYMFGRPYSGTFDLFNEIRQFDTYSEKKVGGGITVSHSFSEYLSGAIGYYRKKVNIFDIDISAPGIVLDQAGKTTVGSVRMSITKDKRDNPFDPHTGYRWSYSIELAERYLAGDRRFLKVAADNSRFFPVWFDNVFSVHLRMGYVMSIGSDEIPIGERFYIGGVNSVRGFDYGWAGPVEGFEIKGGNRDMTFNAEYIIPLIKQNNFQWIFFYDAGKGFNEGEKIAIRKLRQSAGGGIRFITPIGALRLEWARILDKKPEDRERKVEFTIGSVF